VIVVEGMRRRDASRDLSEKPKWMANQRARGTVCVKISDRRCDLTRSMVWSAGLRVGVARIMRGNEAYSGATYHR